MKSLSELNPRNKRVLVRVDWNITLGKALQVVDDMRIKRSLKTIRWLRDNGAKQIVLMAHLGRPEGEVVDSLSLRPVVEYASKLVGESIELIEDIAQWQKVKELVVMLENVRFWSGEKSNSREFAQQLAQWGEVFVNEAFGVSHRKVASVVGVTKLLPSYAGFDLMDEVSIIKEAINKPKKPLVVIVGGAKVEDKLKLLEVISQKAKVILLGGKLANEFGRRELKLSGKARVVLPIEGFELLDIGVKTQQLFTSIIAKAGTVIWNGPMGKVEDEKYRQGTHAIYEALINNQPAKVIVGGGDTVSAIRDERHLERIDFMSTGGGAMLELIEKGTLPGIEVLAN